MKCPGITIVTFLFSGLHKSTVPLWRFGIILLSLTILFTLCINKWFMNYIPYDQNFIQLYKWGGNPLAFGNIFCVPCFRDKWCTNRA